MARWIRAAFDNAMIHVASASLYPLLVAEMGNRGHELTVFVPDFPYTNPEDVTEWGLDIGGMARTNRPKEAFTVGELKLTIPCEDVGVLLADLMKLERRTFEGWHPLRSNGDQAGYKLPYFKLKASSALVMMPTQYNSLRAQLVSRAPAAKRRTEEFEAKLDGAAS